MTERPRITFRVSIPTTASPDAIYDVLSDFSTHIVWGGKEAPSKKFRLLSMDPPPAPAGVGDRFSSSGANSNGTFHDRGVVVEAEPGRRFGFDTESTLDRKHGKPLESRFAHRYVLEPSADGTVISYSCEVRPQNYIPYWLRLGMRPMTRVMVQGMIRKNMRNLVGMAEAARHPA